MLNHYDINLKLIGNCMLITKQKQKRWQNPVIPDPPLSPTQEE